MSKGLLITGATGKQGGAVVDALTASTESNSDYTILAVTRNSPSSPSAQKLLAKSPAVKIVQGDLNDVPALFASAKQAHPNIYGVFSVQVPMGKGQSPETEQAQGKALVDEALKSGVKQFVYTSVDRGANSLTTPTHVPHFVSKYNIEKHLVSAVKGTAMSYTILRPVAFMENITPDFMGKMFGAALNVGLPPNRPLQFVATSDIGFFAAQAFRNIPKNHNREIGVAGDELTFSQMQNVFREKTGQDLPHTYGFLGSALLWGVKEMGTMFDFFRDTGFSVDIKELRTEHPGLKDLAKWIETDSKWAKK